TAAPAVLVSTRRLGDSSDTIFQVAHPECRLKLLDADADAESSSAKEAAAEPALVYLCQVGSPPRYWLSRCTADQLAAEFARLNPRLEAPVGRVRAAILAGLASPAADLRLLSPSLLQLSGRLSEHAAGTEFRWQFRLRPAGPDAVDALLVRPLAAAAAATEAEAADLRDRLGRLGRAAAQLASDNGLRCPRHLADLVADADKMAAAAGAGGPGGGVGSIAAVAEAAGERWQERLARAVAAAELAAAATADGAVSAATSPAKESGDAAPAAAKPARDERLLLRVEDPAERQRREEAKRKLEAEREAGTKNVVKKKKKGLF
ncbi:hypothetical protein BOX15_Mlig015637g4, partial [Macrostomum lignano]